MAQIANKITPFLWFNDNAEEAVDYYLTIFSNSRKNSTFKGPDGKVVTVSFELEGMPFTALNGNREFPFTNAVSFFIKCADQPEIDHYWDRFLNDGGKEIACGWISDKFGLPWQVVPANIMDLIKPPSAFQAMMTMKKLIIADLEAAGRGA